jgi:hypothetical protein
MDDEIASFTAITSASPEHAQRYLQLTDGNLEQAIQLYFEDPSLGAEPTQPRPVAGNTARTAIPIDSDNDSDVDMISASHDEDAEMARRLQAEMYEGQGAEEDDVRAPMARTRETLVGGPAGDFDDMDDDAISTMVQQQLLGRRNRREQRMFSSALPYKFRLTRDRSWHF